MPEIVADPYALAAHLFYLAVATVVAGISLSILAMAGPRERAAIFNPWLFWTTPILIVQTLATLMALVLHFMKAIPYILTATVIAQWLIVTLALAALPGGLILARRHRRQRRGGARGWWLTVLGATVGVLAFSLLWMAVAALVFNPQQAVLLDEIGKSVAGLVILLPIAILAAPLEEILFRLGLQGMLQSLEKKGWLAAWVTIVVPSAIWSLGHAGVLTPHGIKEFQIFVVGLVLGLVYRRYGFGACVAVHLGLNCGALALAPLEMFLFRGG